jgi:hypothetical protein
MWLIFYGYLMTLYKLEDITLHLMAYVTTTVDDELTGVGSAPETLSGQSDDRNP